MSFTKIFILGAGAIGSCYGVLLSRKNDVTLIGNRAHVDAVKSHGLMVKGDLQGKFPVKAGTRISEIPPNSLIILTTKAQDAVEAVTKLKPLLRSGSVLLALQNGLKIRELIRTVVGDKCEVVRGLVFMGAEFLEPGRITLWNGPTIIERSKTGEKIRVLFEKSGLKAKVTADIEKEEWRKLVVNSVVNPLTAILKVRNNDIGVTSLRKARHGIIEECSRVAEAEGAHLDRGFEAEVERKIRGYTNFSSMYQDIAKGKRTEIDFLNGTIVDLGRKHGIRTPVNETLVGLIKFMEAKK